MTNESLQLLEEEWRTREAAHHARIDAWVAGRSERRRQGEHHPVQDFLFDYYPYSVGKLRAWHPGPNVELCGDITEFLAQQHYVPTSNGAMLGALPAARAPRISLAIRILKGTGDRPAQHSCFGLHEWAMVDGLRQEDIRHEQVPLRLPPEAITAVIDEVGLRCTHIDAYRFFTAGSSPKNSMEPTRESQPDVEQPGCIHANMDLYKYAMWASPWLASEIVADCFELALKARDLDMQASPYDVAAYGLAPIHIESPAGRLEYVGKQRAISEEASPLRISLLALLRTIKQDEYLQVH